MQIKRRRTRAQRPAGIPFVDPRLVRNVRLGKGYTQEQTAGYCSLSQKSIVRAESRDRIGDPQPGTVVLLARAFGVAPLEFFSIDDEDGDRVPLIDLLAHPLPRTAQRINNIDQPIRLPGQPGRWLITGLSVRSCNGELPCL